MDNKQALKILPLVNDTVTYPSLLEYIEYRISLLKDILSTTESEIEVRKIQGQIKELTRFRTLRDEILVAGKSNGR